MRRSPDLFGASRHSKSAPMGKRHHRRYVSFDGASDMMAAAAREDRKRNTNDDSYLDLSRGEREWLTLLRQRPELEDQGEMSKWMDKILTLSEESKLKQAPTTSHQPNQEPMVEPPAAIDPVNLLGLKHSFMDSTAPRSVQSSPPMPPLPESKIAVAPKPLTIGDALAPEGITGSNIPPTVSPSPAEAGLETATEMPTNMDVETHVPTNTPGFGGQSSHEHKQTSPFAPQNRNDPARVSLTDMDRAEAEVPMEMELEPVANTWISDAELAAVLGETPSLRPTN